MPQSQPDLPVCKVRRLGRIEYRDALAMQDGMVRLRREGTIPDMLLLLEHPHVVTLGSAASDAHVLLDEQERARRGLDLVPTSRGGDVTYHGPGQVVGYPILLLQEGRRDAHRYLRDLEEVLVLTLADFGIRAGRLPDYTGVWVGDEKIAAIGVRLSRWITSHGFALNVAPDLSYFQTIVPCGIPDKGVTSMQRLLGHNLALEAVEERLIVRFGAVFQRRMVEGGAKDNRRSDAA
jgi:lipoyl(octanoyl) transferase